MAVNDPALASSVRVPNFTVTINGAPIMAFSSVRVTQNAHHSSDTFELTLSLYAQPPDRGLVWWDNLTDAEVEITAGLVGGMSQQLIVGLVDSVDTRLMAGKLILTGRDYTSALIETRIDATTYLNKTSTQAAKLIAAGDSSTPVTQAMYPGHGMSVNIPQQTSTYIGAYYDDQSFWMDTTHQVTEWDLLTACAEREGFTVLMQGKTLYFGPPPQYNDDPYVISLAMAPGGPPNMANAPEVNLSRTMTLARDISVTVQSADALSQKVYKATATSSNSNRNSRSGAKVPPQVYIFNEAALDNVGCLKQVQLKLRQLSQHERIINLPDMPGDPLLTVLTPIKLIGTGSGWDQVYYADEIAHEYRVEEEGGWTMSVRAKNHDTASSVPL